MSRDRLLEESCFNYIVLIDDFLQKATYFKEKGDYHLLKELQDLRHEFSTCEEKNRIKQIIELCRFTKNVLVSQSRFNQHLVDLDTCIRRDKMLKAEDYIAIYKALYPERMLLPHVLIHYIYYLKRTYFPSDGDTEEKPEEKIAQKTRGNFNPPAQANRASSSLLRTFSVTITRTSPQRKQHIDSAQVDDNKLQCD